MRHRWCLPMCWEASSCSQSRAPGGLWNHQTGFNAHSSREMQVYGLINISAHLWCVCMLPGLKGCPSLCRLDLLPLCMGTFDWKDKFMRQVWAPESFLVMMWLYLALFMGCLCHCTHLPCCDCHPMGWDVRVSSQHLTWLAVRQAGVLGVEGSCAECQEAARLRVPAEAGGGCGGGPTHCCRGLGARRGQCAIPSRGCRIPGGRHQGGEQGAGGPVPGVLEGLEGSPAQPLPQTEASTLADQRYNAPTGSFTKIST